MPALFRLFALSAIVLSFLPGLPVSAGSGTEIETAISESSLPKGKQTQAGLYATAAEAAAVLDSRDDVLLIDVRTPEETMLVGYPVAADVNIPFMLLSPSHNYDVSKKAYTMALNEKFTSTAKAFIDAHDPAAVFVMCRSGGRSAKAVNLLAEAGITLPLYSVVDGFEGDKDDTGKRTLNGWKNSNAPWTTKIPEGFLLGVD